MSLLKWVSVVLISVSWNLGLAQEQSEQSEALKLQHNSEAGLVLTGGNTDTRTISMKHSSGAQFGKNNLSFSGRVLYGTSGSETISRNWLLGGKYDRELSDRFGLVLGQSAEGDTFAGFEARYNSDLGGKYWVLRKSDSSYFFNETGYRYTFEDRVPGANPSSQTNNFLRFYFEAMYAWSESVKTQVWIEALPDLTDSENFNLNFEPSLIAVMTSVFSLKTAFLGKYDTQPAVAGNQNFDYTFTTSLVASY